VEHVVAGWIIHSQSKPPYGQPIRHAAADVERDCLSGGDADLVRVGVDAGNGKGAVRRKGAAFHRINRGCSGQVQGGESGDASAGLFDEFATIQMRGHADSLLCRGGSESRRNPCNGTELFGRQRTMPAYFCIQLCAKE
jgi:hypothetical protein